MSGHLFYFRLVGGIYWTLFGLWLVWIVIFERKTLSMSRQVSAFVIDVVMCVFGVYVLTRL
jgi:hypothetical protein